MIKNFIKIFAILQIFVALRVQSVEVRRDDTWPPKGLIEWFKPAADLCKEKTGVKMEAIREFDAGEIHEDASLKCYMYCVFETMELLDSDGRLELLKIVDHVEENYDEEVQEIAFQMGRKCVKPQGDNKCEIAFWYHKCWKTQDPKHYFLV